jgi:hypothetical protein
VPGNVFAPVPRGGPGSSTAPVPETRPGARATSETAPAPQLRSVTGVERAPGDPLAEAEAALQKLRTNPDDKQAADALERALKRLKEERAKLYPGERK